MLVNIHIPVQYSTHTHTRAWLSMIQYLENLGSLRSWFCTKNTLYGDGSKIESISQDGIVTQSSFEWWSTIPIHLKTNLSWISAHQAIHEYYIPSTSGIADHNIVSQMLRIVNPTRSRSLALDVWKIKWRRQPVMEFKNCHPLVIH